MPSGDRSGLSQGLKESVPPPCALSLFTLQPEEEV